jgi:tetratricopeptide (TPR) repeat protein
MQEALPTLGLRGRIGVTTGEVVAGTEERLATGDAVNVAARLEQAAQPGAILIGEPTLALVGAGADVEALEPLELRGKSAPVAAYRLVAIRQAPDQAPAAPFVGRADELARLRQAWERARSAEQCELVTVLGEPGIGKSRLAAELLASVDAPVAQGRALPYGEGITYGPVVEVVRRLDVLPEDEHAASAIRSLLAQNDLPTSGDEIAWAVRKTLERAAAREPLVVVFDDIQWGEDPFLDLIEHVGLLSRAPILLLCLARPELLGRRPDWPVIVRLDALGDREVEALMAARAPAHLRGPIARAAGGNPLFVEEMLALVDEDASELVVPPTLQAVLAARLGALGPDDRRVLERGAVEGEVFHRGAVQALMPGGTEVTPRLAALVRQQLIRPDRSDPAEDAFRFRHLLIRDAAYDGLPKTARADLHARFAAWLAARPDEVPDLDELVGYHLERAVGYRQELGLAEDPELAAAARERLTAAGRRAQLRADYGAEVSLLERAAALLGPGRIDLGIEMGIVEALIWSGRAEEAVVRAGALTVAARAAGDRIAELCAEVKEVFCRSFSGAATSQEMGSVVDRVLPDLEAAGDHVALNAAYLCSAWASFNAGRTDAALDAMERAVAHGLSGGNPDEQLGWRAVFRFYGTTPVPDVLAWLDEHDTDAGWSLWLRGVRGGSLAMLGRFDEARSILAETRAGLAERGGGVELGTITAIESAEVELLAGNLDAALELGTEGCAMLERMGDEGFLSSAMATMAKTLYGLGRLDEADACAHRASELGASDDAFTQMEWRPVSAKVLARRGEHEAAEALAREAIAIAEGTDSLTGQGITHAALGDVLLVAGRRDEALASFETARERYARKGDLVSERRMAEHASSTREAAAH